MATAIGVPDIPDAPLTRDERVVGDYQLERRLGMGAMGEVWLARHLRSQGLAAVKMLRPSARARDDVRKLFQIERRAIGRLCHPNIVNLYDVGRNYLVTAYVGGSDLSRRLRSPIDAATAVRLTRQIASALTHAHQHGVVHRDVKPSNILLDADENAYLGDFGIAHLLDDADANCDAIAGTPEFMAPEQERGEVSPAVDQYALGRTLLFMLLGDLPRRPSDQAPAPPPEAALRQLSPTLPAPLRAAVERATAAEPGARFPSVAAFADALAGIDLADQPAPVRMLAPLRPTEPFAWARDAASVQLTPELVRSELRLSTLVAAGRLDAAAAAEFRAASGYADFGWSMFARADTLGTGDQALARARTVIVLMHGLLCTRESWRPVALAICRNNPQAVVLAPDLHGFGASPFGDARPEHIAPTGINVAVRSWLALLGLSDVPLVLVGHSMGAVALLAAGDDDFGPRTQRVAITPVFPFADPAGRRKLHLFAKVARVVGDARWLRWLIGWLFIVKDPGVKHYTDAQRAEMLRSFMSVPSSVVAALADTCADAQPVTGTQLQRCVILLVDTDPLLSREVAAEALSRLGFPASKVHHLVTGGHMPHAEDEQHPEWTARNVDEIARVIDTVLESKPATQITANETLRERRS